MRREDRRDWRERNYMKRSKKKREKGIKREKRRKWKNGDER